jgi:hypothetical protein
MNPRAILLAIVIGLSPALTLSASAAERRNAMTPACAERDLRVVSLIEAGGEAGVSVPLLAKAGLDQLQARVTCLAGREREALARYDGILRDLSRSVD